MTLNILSIDGGGIRGIIPAMVLAELEDRAGRPAAEMFDLIAGTSTGGIIAAAVTAPGPRGAPRHRAEDVVSLYLREGPRIFSRSLGRKVLTGWGLLEEKYDDDVLNEVLQTHLGDTRVSASLTRLLITAYETVQRAPFFVKSWRAHGEPERDLRLWEAARASSAAPSYFEPALVTPPQGPQLSLLDGGVFATNPAMTAYAEAVRLAPDEPVQVVSLGAGELTRPIPHRTARGWGLAEWVRPLVSIVFDGVADTVDYQLDQLLGSGRYHRFQVRLSDASDDLDDASERNLALLQRAGRRLIATRSRELDRVVDLLAD